MTTVASGYHGDGGGFKQVAVVFVVDSSVGWQIEKKSSMKREEKQRDKEGRERKKVKKIIKK